MWFPKKYRHWVSMGFLALNTFIATPIRLWHHHSYTGKFTSAEIIKNTGQKLIVKVADPADNCPVCNHRYSVYTDICFNQTHSLTVIHAGDGPESYCFTSQANFFHFSNKSPPLAA